ncbi:MAG: hypothetical protein WCO35_01260 [Candidatus Nomurabacteria bacterium]
MSDFFKKVFYTGFKILIAIAIVWIIYFLFAFLSPNSIDKNNTSKNTNSTTSTVVVQKDNRSLGYRIYDALFNNSSKKDNSAAASSSTVKKISKWGSNDASTTYVWGSGNSSQVFGGRNIFGGHTILIPNIDKSPVQNMMINNFNVNYFSQNDLVNNDYISGLIYSGFQSEYFFYIDLYNKDEKLVFSIPAYSAVDLKNKGFYNFHATYKDGWNFSKYKGEGYLVIHTNNPDVNGVLVLKVNIK